MLANYCMSIDMDWASDEVVDYTLSLLDQYNVRATLFMTNKSGCDLKDHEIAIHPNFTTFDFENHIQERLSDFPDAKGTRSHSLFFTERMRMAYEKFNIKYQSNAMMHLQENISPFLMSPHTLELPIFMMDSFYIIMNNQEAGFSIDELNLNSDGLKIFDFHPIHIFLNTDTLARYQAIKHHYHDAKELLRARNSKNLGVKDLFVEILKVFKNNSERCKTLLELNDEIRQKK